MSVPGWVYKRYAMGEISEADLGELEKLAQDLSSQEKLAYYGGFRGGRVTTRSSMGDASDQQLKNRNIELDINKGFQTAGGGVAGAIGGGAVGRRLGGTRGALLGAGIGAVGGALARFGGNRFQKSMNDRTLAARAKSQEKKAEAVSQMGRAGAEAAVADKSNNLHKVMKAVPDKDKDDVLRALRQMKKQASTADRLYTMQKVANIEQAMELMEAHGLSAVEAVQQVYPEMPDEQVQEMARELEAMHGNKEAEVTREDLLAGAGAGLGAYGAQQLLGLGARKTRIPFAGMMAAPVVGGAAGAYLGSRLGNKGDESGAANRTVGATLGAGAGLGAILPVGMAAMGGFRGAERSLPYLVPAGAALGALGAGVAGRSYHTPKEASILNKARRFVGDVSGSTARKATKASEGAASKAKRAQSKFKRSKKRAYNSYEEYADRKKEVNDAIKGRSPYRHSASAEMRDAYKRHGGDVGKMRSAGQAMTAADKASGKARKAAEAAVGARKKARKQTAVGLAGVGAGTLGVAAYKKSKGNQEKTAADFGLNQAAMLMGGAALAPVVSHMAMRGVNSLMAKSPARQQQDLKRILEVHPDIGRPEDPRVQMAYASLTKLNPSYAEDPLIAGPLLKQIVESRMNPADPSSASYVDPGIAKNLSEARKSIADGNPRNTLGDQMGQSMFGATNKAFNLMGS